MPTLAVPPGTAFGRLTVIEEAPRRNGLRAMLCRCECGTVKAADLNGLRCGRITSCGCARREALRRIDVPPGTVFGLFTVIEEARLPVGKSTRRAMLCRCACGKRKTVLFASLRTGRSRSCGCWRQEVQASDVARLNPGEVPLYGKRACGRVAAVDVEDFALVMQYRWHVLEHDPAAPGRRAHGPYVVYDAYPEGRGGTRITVYMHQLITGSRFIDHIDGDPLNNRRSNLRPATKSQNGANARKNPGKTSRYKGVFWDRERSGWQAKITVERQQVCLGRFANEEDAALAYDLAAREAFGEFALTNFPDAPEPAALADWRARREAECAAVDALKGRKISASKQEWWKARPVVTHICRGCGGEFQSNATRVFYCSGKCKQRGYSQQERERQQQSRLF